MRIYFSRQNMERKEAHHFIFCNVLLHIETKFLQSHKVMSSEIDAKRGEVEVGIASEFRTKL